MRVPVCVLLVVWVVVNQPMLPHPFSYHVSESWGLENLLFFILLIVKNQRAM